MTHNLVRRALFWSGPALRHEQPIALPSATSDTAAAADFGIEVGDLVAWREQRWVPISSSRPR